MGGGGYTDFYSSKIGKLKCISLNEALRCFSTACTVVNCTRVYSSIDERVPVAITTFYSPRVFIKAIIIIITLAI